MKQISSYRFWAACLLLLIYGFVATPVTLWHNHGGPCEDGNNHTGKTTLASDCKICSHQYAPTAIPELQELSAIDHVYAFPKAVNEYFTPLAAVLSQSNKGPPKA